MGGGEEHRVKHQREDSSSRGPFLMCVQDQGKAAAAMMLLLLPVVSYTEKA